MSSRMREIGCFEALLCEFMLPLRHSADWFGPSLSISHADQNQGKLLTSRQSTPNTSLVPLCHENTVTIVVGVNITVELPRQSVTNICDAFADFQARETAVWKSCGKDISPTQLVRPSGLSRKLEASRAGALGTRLQLDRTR